MEAKYCAVLFQSDSHRKYHQRRPKMHVLIFFGLIPFLKTDAVLDHLPESIKVKFVVSQIPSPKVRVWTMRTTLYKFNTEIGRHPAMPFIEMHFKERNLQWCFWLFTSLSNP